MTRDVITVTEYTAIEEAARIMADHRISSLPVMRNEQAGRHHYRDRPVSASFWNSLGPAKRVCG